MNEITAIEYLYELWDANWDDGPLGNWQIHRHEITRKTAKRIYFTHRHRTAFVDRQRIEAAGEIFYRPAARTLYLAEPDIPHQPKPPSLPELRKAMADAHPDRGGSNEAFIAARTRYEKAREASLVRGLDLATGTYPTPSDDTVVGQTSPSKGDRVT